MHEHVHHIGEFYYSSIAVHDITKRKADSLVMLPGSTITTVPFML